MDLETLKRKMDENRYVYDDTLATVLFVALQLGRPLLIEGAAGVGKTEIAKVMAAALDRDLVRLQCYEGLDESKALYEWNYQKQLLFSDESRAVDAMEIGYSIAKKHQRKGYGFEALSAVLDLLQKQLGLEMVTAGILPENSVSQQLLTKLGFQREGLRHKAVWHEGLDRPVDLIYFYRDR